jgi:hypothetical protein
MWTVAWNILVSLVKTKIGRALIGLAVIGAARQGKQALTKVKLQPKSAL